MHNFMRFKNGARDDILHDAQKLLGLYIFFGEPSFGLNFLGTFISVWLLILMQYRTSQMKKIILFFQFCNELLETKRIL
jgi:membrane-bound metal-dependent hydrolase YbcI (DUF457 family)